VVVRRSILVGLLTCSTLAHGVLLAQTTPTGSPSPAAIEQFELHVRPVLAAVCAKCHGSEKASGGLRARPYWLAATMGPHWFPAGLTIACSSKLSVVRMMTSPCRPTRS
jgi:hypothetical protein